MRALQRKLASIKNRKRPKYQKENSHKNTWKRLTSYHGQSLGGRRALGDRQTNQRSQEDPGAMEVVNYRGKYYYLHPQFGYVELEVEDSPGQAQKSRFYEQARGEFDEFGDYEEQLRRFRSMENTQKKRKSRKKKKSVKARKRFNNYLVEKEPSVVKVKRKKKIVNKKKKTRKERPKSEKKLKPKKKKTKDPKQVVFKKRPKSKKKKRRTTGKKKIKKQKESIKEARPAPKINPNLYEERIPEVQHEYEQLYNEKSYDVVTGLEEGVEEQMIEPREQKVLEPEEPENLANLEEKDLLRQEDGPKEEELKETSSFREAEYENKLLSTGRFCVTKEKESSQIKPEQPEPTGDPLPSLPLQPGETDPSPLEPQSEKEGISSENMRKFEQYMLNHERGEPSNLNDETMNMEPKLEDEEEEEVDILEHIPKIDLAEPESVDEFKKKMIQLILEFQIESPEGFKTLVEAALEKNSDIEPEFIQDMFVDIEEFIQHFNEGAFDSYEDEVEE